MDKFDRVGESKLYNNFRIEDTYLVIEHRVFDVGEDGGVLAPFIAMLVGLVVDVSTCRVEICF